MDRQYSSLDHQIEQQQFSLDPKQLPRRKQQQEEPSLKEPLPQKQYDETMDQKSGLTFRVRAQVVFC